MRIFVRVAEIASFTIAAQQLEVTTAQASRAISELEVHLRTRLLNRTTRRVALTEAGNRYLVRCKEILGLVELSEAEAGDAKDTPSGALRIHAPFSFGHIYVIPALAEYLEANPRVRAELTMSQRNPDLLDEGYDVSFQVTSANLQDSALVSARICTMPSVLCAAPQYVGRYGVPTTVADLREHACLQLVTPYFPVDHWKFETPGGLEEIDLPPGKLRVNSPDALAGALARGMGIGALPMLSALPLLQSGELVRVLPECKLQEMTVYAVYASREYLDAKIKTWIAFIREYVTVALAAAYI
jgi:DNA-binding transcriptional LysR family regulator